MYTRLYYDAIMADLLGNKRKRQLEPTISVALPQLPLVFPLMPVPVLSSTSGGTPNSSAAVAAPATSSSSSFNSSPIAPLSQPKVTSPSQAPSDSVSDVRPRIRDPLQEWHEKEEKALVEFILLYGKGDQWPATKDDKYWQSAAKFIHERTGMRLRTGGDQIYKYCTPVVVSLHHVSVFVGVACRSRTTGSLRKSFASPKRAEEEMTTADKKRDEEIRSTAVECELHASKYYHNQVTMVTICGICDTDLSFT